MSSDSDTSYQSSYRQQSVVLAKTLGSSFVPPFDSHRNKRKSKMDPSPLLGGSGFGSLTPDPSPLLDGSGFGSLTPDPSPLLGGSGFGSLTPDP